MLCDAFAPTTPSTVEFRPLAFLRGLYAIAGLPEPKARFYQVPAER